MSENIKNKLNEGFPRDQVKTRSGGTGPSLSYAAGHYIIRKLNEIFGQDGWSYTIQKLDKVFEGQLTDKYGKPTFNVSYIAQIQLMSRYFDANNVAVYRADSDIGYGDGQDKGNPGKAHELAVKEAVTDGLKRAAKSLGDALGLALYDKDQENVVDAIEPEAKQVAKPPVKLQAGPDKMEAQSVAKPVSQKEDIKAELNKLIATSGAVKARGRASFDEQKAKMHDMFGTYDKNSLTIVQVREFMSHLETLLK